MSNYEHQPGKGNLFQVANKKKGTEPDLKGSFKTPDGQDYEVAFWYATDKDSKEKRKDVNGNNFFNGTIQKPFNKEKTEEKVDNDLPF